MNQEIIWITGGTKGIGFETAKVLSKTGATVYISARNEINLHDFENIHFIKCDVKNINEIEFVVSKIISDCGKIDVFVNNAGVFEAGELAKTTEKQFDNVFDVNVKGAFFALKAVSSIMCEKQRGFIINVNSVASIKFFSGTSIYSASKAALDCISNSLREEVRESNVQVSNLYPGATQTEIWDDEIIEARAHEMMKPEDVSNAILKLVELKYQHDIVPEELVLRPKGGDL